MNHPEGNKRQLDISNLKEWATTLPPGSTLRAVLLQENTTMTHETFLIKTGTWIQLAKLEDQER